VYDYRLDRLPPCPDVIIFVSTGSSMSRPAEWPWGGPCPVIANFFMENFEEEALKRATNKPLCLFRCVDDTFVIWPHKWEKLNDYHCHHNGIHKNTQFTMETETDGHIPFLDINVYKKPDGVPGT
jgi:hypothetical protein